MTPGATERCLRVDLNGEAVVVAGDDAVDRFNAEHPGSSRIADRPLFSGPADQSVVQPPVRPRRVVDVGIGIGPSDAGAVANLFPGVGPDPPVDIGR